MTYLLLVGLLLQAWYDLLSLLCQSLRHPLLLQVLVYSLCHSVGLLVGVLLGFQGRLCVTWCLQLLSASDVA